MARKKRGRPVHGWLVLDKPAGMTATRATGAVRRLFDAQKAGHAGTLDPLATGVLPIALGEATKTVPYALDGRKTYRFTAAWGEARETDDGEGRVVATSPARPEAAAIRAALAGFVGVIQQRPPAYSAIKVDGERAYDLARSGEEVVLAPRPAVVHAFELLRCPDPDHAEFRAVTGKGVYVRSLVRDLAVALGTVGYVAELRREAVGPFTEAMAVPLAKLEELGHIPGSGGAVPGDGPADALLAFLQPVETALDDIPALALTGSEADRLKQGRPVPVLRSDNRKVVDGLAEGSTLYAMAAGQPVALLTWDGALAHPLRLFNL
ncbi:MAG: tRNA pseudouridine(55) synthase TruB [Rhodospirillaceae bacterium]|nr:tRNA pseudouridine(55) synthase TruB [Rhodospirillaceae bacterium]